MRGLLCIVALTACAKQGGVQISVAENGTKAKQVRLFIGTGAAHDDTVHVTDPRSTAPGAGTYTGQYWARDADLGDQLLDLTGDHVNFFYEPAAAATRLPIVIAVGFDASGAAVGAGELLDVDVPDRGFLTYEIPLSATSPVRTWDHGKLATGPANKCVAFGAAPAHLVVTPSDQDCDGLVDGAREECEPDTYLAATPRPAIPDELTCLAKNNPAVCLAGGAPCMDGTGPVPAPGQIGSCPTPSQYCLPGAICTLCGDFQCARSGATGATAIPHVRCTVGVDSNHQLCKHPMALPPGAASATCSNVRLRDDQQNFLPTLSVESDRHRLQFAATNQGCAISIAPSGDFSDDMPDIPSTGALMAVDTGEFQGFLVPIVFFFDAKSDCVNTCAGFGITGTDSAQVCSAPN